MSESNTKNKENDKPMNEALEAIPDTELVQHAKEVSIRPTTSLMLPNLPEIANFAETIKASALSKNFIKLVDDKEVIDAADIVSCIVMGYEMGLSPMTSITFGRKLNENTLLSVLKGRAMGVDPITAMDKIHVIAKKGGGGVSIAVDVSLINKSLVKAGVKIEILEDYAPVYEYSIVKADGSPGLIVGDDEIMVGSVMRDKFFLFTAATTPAELKVATEKKQILISRSEITKRTKIRFTRKVIDKDNPTVITINYTLQKAIDAGLFRGVTSYKYADGKGEVMKGKDNWNKYPDIMLRNRVLSLGGRIIAADEMQGVYEYMSEVQDIF